MKKNRMMRLASVLLVCVLLTTSVISGTFAKYTTSGTASDKARVAYWGFEDTTIENFTLFTTNDDGILDNNLLAPGSSGSATIDFVYTPNNKLTESDVAAAPEVDYTFEIAVTTAGYDGEGEADIEMLDANPNFLWVLDGVAYQKFDDFKKAVEALDGNVAKYEAGTLPASFYGDETDNAATHTIGWEWLFGENVYSVAKSATGNRVLGQNVDALDTEMGNNDDLEDLKITITITATQVN